MYGEYDDKTLKKLQGIELMILKDINDICDHNDIEYFAVSGTAIGAIRHKGFIPWDDDIDIAMLRSDYERFVSVIDNDPEFSAKYELLAPDRKHKYYNLQPTLMLKNTVFVNENAATCGFRPGISIDIFIYDAIPGCLDKSKKIIKMAQLYKILYLTRNVNYMKLLKGVDPFQKLKNIILGLLRVPLRMIKDSDKYLFDHFEKYALKYRGKSSHYTCLFDPGAYIMGIDIRRSYPTVKLPFEDSYVRMLTDYDEQLKRHMGDYMTLPPEDKRTNHFPVELDFGEY